MEFINRYVHQVGRRLPQRMRADVEQELRSLLIDALEERTGRKSDDAAAFSEEDQIAVLKEFGPPQQMADKYRPQPKYVIGPKVYDLYLIVVLAVAGAGLVAAIVTAAVSTFAGSDGLNAFGLLAQSWSIFINVALGGIGTTTLVFAILERVIPDERIKLDEGKAWNPRDLPAIEVRDEVKRAGLIVETAILVALMAAFIALGKRVGSGAYYDGAWHTTPSFLSDAFFSAYLPLFFVRWSLTCLLNLVLLRQGRWQLGTQIADLLFHGLDVFILSRLLSGPSLLNPAAFQAVFGSAPEAADTLLRMADGGLKIAFLVALIVVIIDIARRIYRLIRDRSAAVTIPIETQGGAG